jgi:hypothetical protein
MSAHGVRQVVLCLAVAVAMSVPSIAAGARALGSSTASDAPLPSPALHSSSKAVATAKDIGLHVSDFGDGTPSDPTYPAVLSGPTDPSPCTPVSSKPWLADVNSRSYGLDGPLGGTNDYAYSNVVVMRSHAAAESGLRVTSTPAYAKACTKEVDDFNVISGYSPTASCGSFSFVSSKITLMTRLEQGVQLAGSRGVITQRCSRDHSIVSNYTDTLETVIGPVLIEGNFVGLGQPIDLPVEFGAMGAMASRADVEFPTDRPKPEALVASAAAKAVHPSPEATPVDGLTVRTISPGVFGRHDPADECGHFGTQIQVAGNNCYVVVQFTNVGASTRSFVPADLIMIDQNGNSHVLLPVVPACYDKIDVHAIATLKPHTSMTVQLSYPVQPNAILRDLSGGGSLQGLQLVVPKNSVLESWPRT